MKKAGGLPYFTILCSAFTIFNSFVGYYAEKNINYLQKRNSKHLTLNEK